MEFRSEYYSDWKDVNIGFRLNAYVDGQWISPYIAMLPDSALQKPCVYPRGIKAISASERDTFYCFPFLCDRGMIWEQVNGLIKVFKRVEIMVLDYDKATSEQGIMFGGNEVQVRRCNIVFRGEPKKFIEHSSEELQRYIREKAVLRGEEPIENEINQNNE